MQLENTIYICNITEIEKLTKKRKGMPSQISIVSSEVTERENSVLFHTTFGVYLVLNVIIRQVTNLPCLGSAGFMARCAT